MEIQEMILCFQETRVIGAPILAATVECYSVWWDHLLLPTLFDKGRNTRDWCKSYFSHLLTSSSNSGAWNDSVYCFLLCQPHLGTPKDMAFVRNGFALVSHPHSTRKHRKFWPCIISGAWHSYQELNMPLCNLFIKQCNYHCTGCLDTVSHNCMTWNEVSWVIGIVICLLISCQSTQHCNIWANRSFKLHIHASAISEDDKWDGIHSVIYLTKTPNF